MWQPAVSCVINHYPLADRQASEINLSLRMSSDLTEEESLALIQETIQTARNDLYPRDSFFLLWWGYLLLLASSGHYLLLHSALAAYAPHMWWLMLVGVTGSIAFSRWSTQNQRVKTFFDDTLRYVWIAISVGLAMVGIFAMQLRQHAFPVIFLLYGIGLFTTGGTVKFKPLLIGGVVCWLVAGLAFRTDFSGQLLLAMLAALGGFIVPGHLLLHKAKRHV